MGEPMRRSVTVVAGALVAALALGIVGAVTLRTDESPSTAGAVGVQPYVPVGDVDDWTPTCGFPGSTVSAITADGPTSDSPTLPTWDPGELSGSVSLHAAGEVLGIQTETDDGATRVRWFDATGRALNSATFDFERDTSQPDHNNGPIAVTEDAVFAVDSYGGRRDLVRFDGSGAVVWSVRVPDSPETTGHPLDLTGVWVVSDGETGPVLLVGEGTHTVHRFTEDGEYEWREQGLADEIVDADGSVVFGVSRLPDGATGSITGTDFADDRQVMQLATVSAPDDLGSERSEPSTPAIKRLRQVVVGPDGEGYLVLDEHGISWIDRIGVRKGIFLDGTWNLGLIDGQLVRTGGSYVILADVDGSQRVVTMTDDQMRAAVLSPKDLNAGVEDALATMAVGLGAVTHQELNHFDAGTSPRVELRAEQGWGVVGDSEAEDLEVRYSVAGDPRLADPVVGTERAVDVPTGGGEVALELPETPPGPYLVSLALVDTASDEVLSGQCLHFSVGSADTPLGATSLADGADWGGPAPLRGAQLADRLGVGSYRIQLDFGSLVPDPSLEPSADAIDWESLPGAEDSADGDPPDAAHAFAQIRAADAYSARNGVVLVVQVGGGDAARAAVDSGTWGGWVSLIVAEFARQAPAITHWSPWNEPNNDDFPTVSDYITSVEVPFAAAVHAVAPDASVLGGNTLGLAVDWWSEAAAAGVCEGIDAVAVHPYTGWNRSWEEEGFNLPGQGIDAVRDALDGTACADLPIWDTESGWTADGALAYWAQGSNVARKLVWYLDDGVTGWTYFYSEGGWGENDLSWSLIQVDDYVKPGGLAFQAVSRLLDGAASVEEVSTGVPNTYAIRVGGERELLAVWSDDMRVDVHIVAPGVDQLEVVDQYGASRTVTVTGGEATLLLSGAPQFIVVPDGVHLAIAPSAPFGADVLAGAQVVASSTHDGSDPQVITSGSVNPDRPWRSGRLADGSIDPDPAVEVSLNTPTTIDRIAVASGSAVCCETSLRTYTVSVRLADGSWQIVAEPAGQFVDRVQLLAFDPLEVTAVRVEVPWTQVRGVRVLDVNYTGFAGGLPPPFMGLQTETDYVAAISSIAAWDTSLQADASVDSLVGVDGR